VPQHGLQDARWSRLWLGRRLRPWVFGCLIGLLSVTGPRISEVLNLELGGVDREDAVLTICSATLGRPSHFLSSVAANGTACRRRKQVGADA
jgi:integrase